MEQHIPLSGPIDLDALDDYLLCDRAPADTWVCPILRLSHRGRRWAGVDSAERMAAGDLGR